MIEELRIQGYRSLRDVTWKPGKLNVLIGPNGGGKSNLLRSLQLLQAAADGRLRDTIIRQGGMAPILWDGATDTIALTVRIDVKTTGYPGLTEVPISYDLELSQVGRSGGFYVRSEKCFGPSGQPTFFAHGPHASSGPDETNLATEFRFPGASPAVDALRRTVVSFRVHQDLRVDQQAEVRQSAISFQEMSVSEDGQNLATLLGNLYQRNREFEDSIDRAMAAAFPDDYQKLVFPPEAKSRIELSLRRKQTKRLDAASDLSDGTLRFLMLAAILCNPDPPSLIAIDEPELGLHPRMLSIVADLAAAAAQRTQVVISTHSERFLDAFDGELPTTTVVEWDGKETHLKTFQSEQLKDWLKNYSLGEFSFSGEAEALA